VERHRLSRGDRVDFGKGASHLLFGGDSTAGETLLTQIARMERPGGSSDLEKLTVFLEIARKLNSTSGLEDILQAIVEVTLRLTHAERGFVFLRRPDGSLYLAAGMSAAGLLLHDDSALSRSIVQEAAESASEFLVTDTQADSALRARQSIVAFDLRTVIAIPLREPLLRGRSGGDERAAPVIGVLYLDSRVASGGFSSISNDILRAIASEAAGVVNSARLAEAEEDARRYEQELQIAASIQQRLMTVTIPRVDFAEILARSHACRAIGGDFFDVVATDRGLALVVTDVSGKGVSAAILASTLQGMIYAQLVANVPIAEIATSVNRFLCQKALNERYATMVMLLATVDGALEYVNCGHIPPLTVRADRVEALPISNLPVGLFEGAIYQSGRLNLRSGDSLLVVTDGVTEAEDSTGELFGPARLQQAAIAGCGPEDGSILENVFAAVDGFRGRVPLGDDCTAVTLRYVGGVS
jgi:serine phosphatase RsbU (regulator of sigma subunit)